MLVHAEAVLFAETDIRTMLEAYHEAGHAVVGHALGRCIESVALVTGEDGHRGFCRFSSLIEDANGHPEWPETKGSADLITIYYAGMLATAYVCSYSLALDETEEGISYPEGSERADLEQIEKVLSQMDIASQQREALTNVC